MQEARHQMPARAGRSGGRQGEALSEPGSDEATCPRCDAQSTGPGLLEAALARENLQRAWKRVKANKGAAGADGLSIEATAAHLRTSWPGIRERVLAGTYRPMPVRRVTIPKPDGGERELGIPTVTDRLIQQALLQVLQPLLDPTFSEHSHGFRPGRSAHDVKRNEKLTPHCLKQNDTDSVDASDGMVMVRCPSSGDGWHGGSAWRHGRN